MMTPNETLTLQVSRQESSRLVAKLCTVLESFGLEETQYAACRRVVKDVVWDANGRIEGALRGQYIGTGEKM